MCLLQLISYSGAWAQSVQAPVDAVLAPQTELDQAIIQYAKPLPIPWSDLQVGS